MRRRWSNTWLVWARSMRAGRSSPRTRAGARARTHDAVERGTRYRCGAGMIRKASWRVLSCCVSSVASLFGVARSRFGCAIAIAVACESIPAFRLRYAGMLVHVFKSRLQTMSFFVNRNAKCHNPEGVLGHIAHNTFAATVCVLGSVFGYCECRSQRAGDGVDSFIYYID